MISFASKVSWIQWRANQPSLELERAEKIGPCGHHAFKILKAGAFFGSGFFCYYTKMAKNKARDFSGFFS